VFYSQESIGQLFMAGLVPGVIAVILLSITAIIISKKRGLSEIAQGLLR
jgi:TRAP-type C4-dicarboxylate transport system permease large subunit